MHEPMIGQLAGMLFLMAMPYIVLFGIGGGLLLAYRRGQATAERNAEGDRP